MSVRAKFTVVRKEGSREEGGTVTLRPVYGGSPENDQFYRWTPGGQIELSTVNQAAFNAFEEGAEYYVDFHRAEGS